MLNYAQLLFANTLHPTWVESIMDGIDRFGVATGLLGIMIIGFWRVGKFCGPLVQSIVEKHVDAVERLIASQERLTDAAETAHAFADKRVELLEVVVNQGQELAAQHQDPDSPFATGRLMTAALRACDLVDTLCKSEGHEQETQEARLLIRQALTTSS
jgi:hypothetical protein